MLRKGKLQYYRIELPKETAEDRAKVEELKAALPTVLKFEKTPCPFKRGFQVDLPDDAITPRRKGKWKARDSSLLSSPDPATPSVRQWKSSRPSMPYTPPSAFPDSFNKRRQTEFRAESPISPKPVQLARRSSVAERRAAFENLQTSSRPPSRPQTPASTSSGLSQEDRDSSDQEASIEAEDSIREDPPKSDELDVPTGDHVDAEVLGGEAVAQESYVPSNMQDPEVLRAPDQEAADVPAPIIEEPEIEDISDRPAPVNQPGLITTEPTVHAEPASREDDDSATSVDATIPLESQSTEVSVPTTQSTVADATEASEMKTSDIEAAVTQESDSSSTNVVEAKPSIETEIQTTEDKPKHDIVEHENHQEAPESDFMAVTESGVPALQTDDAVRDDAASIASTADSFHSTDDTEHQFIHNDPGPAAEMLNPFTARQSSHKRDISEITVTASTFSEQPDVDGPSTPRLVHSSMSDESWPDVQTPSTLAPDGLRQRKTGPRSLSPLPSSSNIVTSSPTQPSPARISAAMVQKAAVFAVTKPIEIVVLAVQILARIAGGATLNDLLNGGLFQRPEERRARHTRNPSFPDRIAFHSDDDSEDDFGVPIRTRRSQEQNTRPAPIKEETGKESDVDSLFADDLD